MLKKIAVVHPAFGYGGTEGVCAWTLMALSERYSIDLITFDENISLKRLNNFYGTNLNPSNVKIKVLTVPQRLRYMSSGFSLLRQHLMMREIKKMRNDYDIWISTYNEMDFGERGIQYIHFPGFGGYEILQRKGQSFGKCWYHRPSPIRWCYERFGELISGFSRERVKQNLTITNSYWTSRLIKKAYGIDSIVLYPPVYIKDENLIKLPDFHQREAGFVAIGRLSPDKRLVQIIEILKEVRRRGFDVHLHIVGNKDRPHESESYYQLLRKLQSENSSWIFIEEGITREDLIRLLSRHKFGIHGKINEHFGIAVAEMVKLGLVVFVHNSGGQVEIVGENPYLVYEDNEDAVSKICRVLEAPDLQLELHNALKERGELFSVENFTKGILEIVESFENNL